MQGVHKIIQSASWLVHTLSDHLIAARLENLHVEIGSLIRAIASYSFYGNIRTNISYYALLFGSSV
jgi:hypothetical protein